MSFAAKAIFSSIAALFLFSIAAPTIASDKPAADDSTAQKKPDITETQVIEWPADAGWHLGNTFSTETSTYSLYYPKNQGEQNWKEMVTLEVLHSKDRIKTNLPGLARITFLGTQKGSPDATWDILEKGYEDSTKQYPHIIYEIDCPDFLSEEPAQVQLWKLTSGKTALFNLQYSYRGKEMPADKKKEILDVLKKSYIAVETAGSAKE